MPTMAQAIKIYLESAGGKVTAKQIKDNINAEYPLKWKPTTLEAHLYACAVNHPTAYIHHRFVPKFLFRNRDGTFELYSEERHGPNTWAPRINVEDRDLSDEEMDQALQENCLRFGPFLTDTRETVVRIRKGMQMIHKLTLENYGNRCAVCDVSADSGLLIASHIARWADDPEGRGDLSNVICLCRIHDALFEAGYWSLRDNLELLKRETVPSKTIQQLLDAMMSFRRPLKHSPEPCFVKQHRERIGLRSERQCVPNPDDSLTAG